MKFMKTKKKLKVHSYFSNKPVLMTGNDAVGEAAIKSGCRFYAGYPITPQNELTAYMSRRMRDVGGVFIQAESELAAINMVFGASSTGTRAMTSSSSPGISLKQEGISYIAGCELPAVIVNAQRGGPGLGNIGPSQSDYFQATKGGGHGDYHLIVLAPTSVEEAFTFTVLGFDLADYYRNPVMILSDAIIGQMAEGIVFKKPRREYPKKKKAWALTGARGRPQNIIRSLYLGERVLEKHNLKLQEKYHLIEKKEVRFRQCVPENAGLLVVAYGSMYRLAKDIAAELNNSRKRVGLFCPLTLWPFPYRALEKAAKGIKNILVVEMSYGQMLEDVRLALGKDVSISFFGRAGGEVPEGEEIIDYILKKKLL